MSAKAAGDVPLGMSIVEGKFTSSWIEPKWTACSERPPDADAPVLFVAHDHVYVGCRVVESNSTVWWRTDGGFLADRVVTHWMPRPELPK